MSYSVQRNNNGRVIEKSLNPGQSIGLTISESLGAIYDDYTTNINTLSLNNQIVNATANELNKTIEKSDKHYLLLLTTLGVGCG